MPFISQLPGRLREPVFLAATFPSILLALSTGQKIILFSETEQKNLPFNIDLYSLQLRVCSFTGCLFTHRCYASCLFTACPFTSSMFSPVARSWGCLLRRWPVHLPVASSTIAWSLVACSPFASSPHTCSRMSRLHCSLLFCSNNLRAEFFAPFRRLFCKQVLLSLVRNLLVETRKLLSLVPGTIRRPGRFD